MKENFEHVDVQARQPVASGCVAGAHHTLVGEHGACLVEHALGQRFWVQVAIGDDRGQRRIEGRLAAQGLLAFVEQPARDPGPERAQPDQTRPLRSIGNSTASRNSAKSIR